MTSCGSQTVTDGEVVFGVQAPRGVAFRRIERPIEVETPGVGIAKSSLPSRLKSLAIRSLAEEFDPTGNSKGVPW